MKYIKELIIILVFVIINCVFAQTDTLNISWNRNIESDTVEYYILLRAVSQDTIISVDEYVNIETVYELPDPVSVIPRLSAVDRTEIDPGFYYSYRVIAVDNNDLTSDLSDPDGAGIPIVFNTEDSISAYNSISFGYFQFVRDPDHAVTDLTVDVSNTTNIIVINNASNRILEFTPDSTETTAGFSIVVKDPDGYWDSSYVNIFLDTTKSENHPAILYLNYDWVTEELSMFFQISTTLPSRVVMDYWYDPTDTDTYESSGYTNVHNFQIGPLEPDTVYSYSISLEDTNGVLRLVRESTFRTESGVEVESEINTYAFPNPYRPSQGHTNIIFDNLPEESKQILIFTPVGAEVYSKDINGISSLEWNVVNNNGDQVASGYYIYVIKGKENKKLKSGKIAIIR